MLITTHNCSRHGHPEFGLHCADEVAFDAPWLVTWLEEQVASGVVFRPGESLQVGWSTLLVGTATDGLLTLNELDLSGVPGQFDRSVTRTLLCMRKQKSVLESFGIEPRMDFPLLQMSAIKCNRYASSKGTMLSRSSPINASDSGWFFGCLDGSHDHNLPADLMFGSLYEIACQKPAAIEFLAMPVGSLLRMDERGALLAAYLDEEKELSIRPGSYLDHKRRNTNL